MRLQGQEDGLVMRIEAENNVKGAYARNKFTKINPLLIPTPGVIMAVYHSPSNGEAKHYRHDAEEAKQPSPLYAGISAEIQEEMNQWSNYHEELRGPVVNQKHLNNLFNGNSATAYDHTLGNDPETDYARTRQDQS
ncbi:hypothetical protein JXA12_04200 [Candidatus Woesearchaeota archaeon]|nr:hypothetical protein [Candidatus Woesearchaeota archaeon]